MIPDSRVDINISKYGLAIITGGSSGIGNSFIQRMRKLQTGPKICNLSRDKPNTFFNDSQNLHLKCDLSDAAERKRVFQSTLQLAERDSTGKPILLINNAGFGLYEDVDTTPVDEHLELIEVNISALVELTLTLLPVLKARGGTIMNIASTSAFQATPHLATYGASKAFVLNWTLAVNEELRAFPKTRAIAICPGPTRTQFYKRAGFSGHVNPAGLSMSSASVVEKAFEALAKRSAYTVIGKYNKLIAHVSSRLPKGFGTRLAANVIGKYRSSGREGS